MLAVIPQTIGVAAKESKALCPTESVCQSNVRSRKGAPYDIRSGVDLCVEHVGQLAKLFFRERDVLRDASGLGYW